jgi:predicted DNA-binding transcriptional regulator YafY
MDRTERFYRIERLLRERKVVPRRAFLEALEVSLATFKRDLEYLRERLEVPIEWNADKGGYELGSGRRFELPGLWFNDSEIHALLLMDAMLADLTPGLLEGHVAPLRARLEMLLEEGQVPAPEVRKRVRVLRQAARSLRPGVFEVVAAATFKRRRLRIAYAARSTGVGSERVVSPQRLVLYRDNWYLDAWCHLREGLRKFSVDAVASAAMLDEKAKPVDMKTVERELDRGYGIFAGRNVDWASLRFSPNRARWVAHERWHAAQRGRLEPDGAYVLELPFSDTRELVMDILRHGADVEVLGPPSLRAAVADEVRRMAAALAR